MLLNKYQCWQDWERRHQEERSQHDEDHWWCPFFAFYWTVKLSISVPIVTILWCIPDGAPESWLSLKKGGFRGCAIES
jgi:hypothetical protein